jgi:hypothetical protein
MRGREAKFNLVLLLAVVSAGLVAVAPAALAATAPVTVSVAVTGTPAFGATVTAKATVTINDGSTLQSITWNQTGGAAATLANADTDTVSVTLGSRAAYRQELITILGEPPSASVDEDAYAGGIQNRFQVVAVSPRSLEEAGATALDIAVVTTSGTYHSAYSLATPLPWRTATGLRNVPTGIPVMLSAKTQASYNWALAKPAGSSAALADVTTQSPEFTPDMAGIYTVTVTDLSNNQPAILTIYAGTWKGIITGQDANGRPTVDSTCTTCHGAEPSIDKFTPWAQSGHAEIFTQNVNTPNGHYSTSCVSCHTVGYDTGASNNGIDDQPDWAAFLQTPLLTHGDPTNWTNIIAQFPDIAKEANIQCENCHGPQNSQAHYKGDGSRTTLSSDMCGICHGEPARHGRYQQWEISGHANFATAQAEGTNASCAKCHSAQGFLQFVTGPNANDQTKAVINVTWTTDTVQPQTCATCHDPHAEGTTSSSIPNNATVRISGNTPMLDSGFVATNLGRGAICATCHNSRRGLRNDSIPLTASGSTQAPHVPAQADMLMGQNLYFVDVNARSNHSLLQDSCVTCHMEKTAPPSDLSLPGVGTNHDFKADPAICSKCHSTITTASVQGEVESKLEQLQTAIGQAIVNVMTAEIQKGRKIDLGGLKTVTDTSTIDTITLTDSHGAQAINVTFKDTTTVGPVTMSTVKSVAPNGTSVAIYSVSPVALPKAFWNYLVIETDGSLGVHNPTFIKRALDLSIYAVQNAVITTPVSNPGANGGPGGGFGAVSCQTPYVYWTEIAAHLPGANDSQWRTDMVARNLSTSTANLKLILHTGAADFQTTGTVPARAMGTFEDVVKAMGQTNAKGSLEICSSQPLLVLGRMFTVTSGGTYGQFLDGHVANLGLNTGDTGSLLGLRQALAQFRTNISVTNGGTIPASVDITLFDTTGTALTTFTLSVPAGQVVQDLTPFATRASKPDLGWGFATVKVTAGFNIQTSASVIDEQTNDAVTIPAKM